MSTLPKHPHELIGEPDRKARATNAANAVRERDQRREHGATEHERADADDDLGRTARAHERRRVRPTERAQSMRGVRRVDGLERAAEHDQRARDHERAREHAHGVVVVVGDGWLVGGTTVVVGGCVVVAGTVGAGDPAPLELDGSICTVAKTEFTLSTSTARWA